ncbi:putative vitamin B12 independent methionine synthase [Blattamonas nauphoetae]|uniref:Vitamin B12 independent methionine synthase n=1 Tax=Blattamonas nauphoetae TaxID=2049346 RepID=A0ABQ9Y6U8_9EUKA|nr:putative vitamin B12 independent methionine synthase [Blattamonas nauphoetae]
MSKITGPYRADQVGSLLRTQAIHDARKKKAAGEITDAELKSIEDQEILTIVKKQAEIGLKSLTDGEFRRSWYMHDFFYGLIGIEKVITEAGCKFNACETRPEGIHVSGRVAYNPDHPFFSHFDYLKSVVPEGCVAKMTIPSCAILLDQYVLYGTYPPVKYSNEEEYLLEVAQTYNQTIKEFYRRGCRYLQLDDTTWGGIITVLLSPAPDAVKEAVREKAQRLVRVTNLALEGIPDDLLISLHICRGNYKSDFLFSGAYNCVSEYLAQLNVDGYFLEYDNERAGGFDALEAIAKADTAGKKRVVLGVFTSKEAKLENEDEIKARIDEAAKYFPKERLCLSAQCGFASTEEGNCLTEEEQFAKLSLIVKVAKDVWGSI